MKGSAIVFVSSLTQIHMLEEGHVHGLANSVGLVGVEHDLAAIVALLEGRQDIGRVVSAVTVARNMAGLVSDLARGERVEWLMGMARGTTRQSIGLGSSIERQDQANGLCQDIGHLHCDEQQFRSDQIRDRAFVLNWREIGKNPQLTPRWQLVFIYSPLAS